VQLQLPSGSQLPACFGPIGQLLVTIRQFSNADAISRFAGKATSSWQGWESENIKGLRRTIGVILHVVIVSES
jgi:hypothetical protein